MWIVVYTFVSLVLIVFKRGNVLAGIFLFYAFLNVRKRHKHPLNQQSYKTTLLTLDLLKGNLNLSVNQFCQRRDPKVPNTTIRLVRAPKPLIGFSIFFDLPFSLNLFDCIGLKMSDSLNMTLDEIVKRSKTAKSGGKGISRRSGRGRGPIVGAGRRAGPARRGPLAVNARPSSFSINKLARRKRSLPWQNDLFEESMKAVGVPTVEVGTTVYVTNLDQGVTNEDIRELFGEIGELKRYAIHYDQNGRPNGSAEVVYMRRSDAFQAMKRYNNVLLDGRSMKLEILGGNTVAAPVAARVNVTGLNGRMKRTVFIGQGVRGGRGRGRVSAPSARRLPIGSQNQQGSVRGGRGGFSGRGRGRGQGGGGGRGGKSGRGGKKPVEKSAAELDKDLESYHAEAMNIS